MKIRLQDRQPVEFKLNQAGFLVAECNIARVGVLEYLGAEIEGAQDPSKMYSVEVTAEELFNPETMASFEGSDVTIYHPEGLDVNSKNWKEFAKGHAQNVRRDGDYLKATVYVKDAKAIQEIQEKNLKQLSIGHDSHLVKGDKTDFKKTQIKGNHVAIVPSGRAGDSCRLGDEDRRMKVKKSLADHFAGVLGVFKKRLGDEAISAEDKQSIEEAIKALEEAIAALPAEGADTERQELQKQIDELKAKLEGGGKVGDEEPQTDDVPALKARITELEEENTQLKAKIAELEGDKSKGVALGDAMAHFPKVKFGDAKTARDVYETVLADSGAFTKEQMQTLGDEAVQAAYATLIVNKNSKNGKGVGKALLGDSKSEPIDFNKKFGGKK